PHDRGRLQGVCAGAAPGSRRGPHRDRRAEHEGNAHRMTATTGARERQPIKVGEEVEIAVVDYGMGNRRSVEKALQRVGASVRVSSGPRVLRAAAGLVVPGVGAFPRAMDNLRELGLDELLRARVAAGTPVLGICLGLELAFERSTEQGGSAGLE